MGSTSGNPRSHRLAHMFPLALLIFVMGVFGAGGSSKPQSKGPKSPPPGSSGSVADQTTGADDMANASGASEGAESGKGKKSTASQNITAFVLGASTKYPVTGLRFDLTIVAVDGDTGLISEDFDGAVILESSDAHAHLPRMAVFHKKRRGVHTVRNVSFETPGEQSITVKFSDNAGFVESTEEFLVLENATEGPRPKRLGDVSGDGKIDQADQELLALSLEGLVELNGYQRVAGDLDRDSDLTSQDVALLAALTASPGEASGSRPGVAILAPVEDGQESRNGVEVRVAVGDPDGDADISKVVVFSNRVLATDGFVVRPGHNISQLADVSIEDGIFVVRTPKNAFPIGRDNLAAAMVDAAGNIGFAEVAFGVSGTEIVKVSDLGFLNTSVAIAAHEGGEDVPSGVAW